MVTNRCGRKRVGTFAIVLLSATVVLDARQRATYRAGVDLVTLSVTVTDAGGRPVGGLDAKDFVVLEDGRRQQLTYFAPATTGLSVSLLVDSSASMEEQMFPAQKAASDFVARLRPGDVAQIVDFDSRVQILQTFTDDQSLLEAAIQRLAPGGSTSLFNAVYVSLRELEALRASTADEVRREVIVLLSDGEDTSSLVEFDQVMDLARRSQTVIYTIALGAAGEPARAAKPMSGEFALRRMAVETGGRMFTTKEAAGLAGVYSEISRELTSQYVLGYLSTGEANGRWRQLSVRVGQPNLQARTRTGYFASASSRRQ